MIKETENTSEPKNTEETKSKIRIYIDPTETDGGLITNDKLLVGYIDVDKEQADDILRRLAEYREIKQKYHDRAQKLTIKNSNVIEQMFLADPATNRNKVAWTDEYGMLDPWQWEKLPRQFKKELKEKRKALYGI